MRRPIVHPGAGELKYEIREIVEVAKILEGMGKNIVWENIGDPVLKGEAPPDWVKEIVIDEASKDHSYAYSATMGNERTREFLAKEVNNRGGAQITKNDIVFFNGLGDAVSTLFAYLRRESRVMGPSPAYSTLSSAEAAHSGYHHATYHLDPKRAWMPDLEDIEMKIRYNDSIAGILLINPDNPTGAVYPKSVLEEIVEIARNHDLFILCDETYANVTFDDERSCHLSEVIGEVPGIALRSISKEVPWPGARCGWMEVFNQNRDPEFQAYIKSIIDAKRLEVCSTSLPQLVIPKIFSDPRYGEHLQKRNHNYMERAKEAVEVLSSVPGVTVNMPHGSFFLTVVFDKGVLHSHQKLTIADSEIAAHVDTIVKGTAVDKQFVYYLLGSKGICVVPLSGFASELKGFRMTVLESNDDVRRQTLQDIKDALMEYLSS